MHFVYKTHVIGGMSYLFISIAFYCFVEVMDFMRHSISYL